MISIIRLPELKARTGLSKTTIYDLISAGKFPDRVKIGQRSVGWISAEIDDWVSERISSSRGNLKPDS